MNTPNSSPILCGTDFSVNSQKAADVAAALAARLGVPFQLIHASVIPGSPLTHQHLQEEAQRLQKAGVELAAEVVEGDADTVLCQLARERHARLLVVSSLGRRRAVRWLLGSVAERTAEASPVPTLVVRDAAPLEDWARGIRPLRVFVGADFSASADAALQWIAALRQAGPCEVTVAYAAWPPQEAARLGIFGAIGPAEDPAALQLLLERDLREKVTRVLGENQVQVRVQTDWRRTDVSLLDMAVKAQADLVVVGAHQRHGLHRLRHDSVSRALLHHAPMSVVCVPTTAAAPVAGPRIRECRRVLVAVDLNEPHGFETPYAYSIVQPGGTVRLVHNIESFRMPVPGTGGSPGELSRKEEQAQQIAACEERLRALAPSPAEARGIVTEVEVTSGQETAHSICSAAERFGADIVCLGVHTRHGFTDKKLGSVPLAVLQSCRRPALVVWPPAE